MVDGQCYAPAAFPPGKLRYQFTGDWGGSDLVWTNAENLASTGIRSPDRPARSESLYQQLCRFHVKVGQWLFLSADTQSGAGSRKEET